MFDGALLTLLLLATPIQDSPNFAELAARASAARGANDPQSAVSLYKQALAANPKWAEGWWMAGSLQYEADQYAGGAEALGHLVALQPAAGPAWALLGLCDFEIARYEEAFDAIQKALTLGIGDQPQMLAVLKFHEALLLTKRSQFDTALEKYAAFVPAQVSDEQVLLGLGLANLRRGLTPAEIASAAKRDYLLAGRALAATLAHDDTAAKGAYAELLRAAPANPNVHYAYGYFLFGKDADAAMREWEQAVALEPTHAAAHAMLAWGFWLRDERDEALAHAAQAAAKDSSQVVALIVLGRMLAQSGKMAEGTRHLERAIQLAPDNLEAHLALATAYSEAGRKLDAQRERQLCLTKQSEAGAGARP